MGEAGLSKLDPGDPGFLGNHGLFENSPETEGTSGELGLTLELLEIVVGLD